MKYLNVVCFLLLAIFILTVEPVLANDKGKNLFNKNLCHTCHGVNGKTNYPNYPNLAGHDARYIQNQFLDIQSKRRNNGLTLLMNVFPTVIKIKPEEIKEISEYLTSLP